MMPKTMPKTQCRRRTARLLTVLVALVGLSLTAIAQDQSQYDRGTAPQHAAGVSSLGSYVSAGLGTINLGNGSLNFRLPIGGVGGRGFSLPLTLNYSSKLWSGRKSQIHIDEPLPEGRDVGVAWAAYNDGTEDFYYSVAPGWTVGAVPFLRVRGQGITSLTPNGGCGTEYQSVLTKLTLVLPDKGEIELRDDQRDGAPATAAVFGPTGCRTQDGYRARRWHATDGSGIIFINGTDNGVVNGNLEGVVITADGTRYHFVTVEPGNPGGSAFLNTVARCNWVEDRNGNKIEITYPNSFTVQYKDQLNRITTIRWDDPFNQLFDPENPSVRLALLVTLPGYNGSPHYYKVKAGEMNDNYRNGINPILPVWNGAFPSGGTGGTLLFPASHDVGMEQIDSLVVLTQLILPDTRALTFKYNQFGEVAEVQLPTGGKVQYDHATVTFDAPAGKGLPVGNSLQAEIDATGAQGQGNVKQVDRAVVARRTYPDGSTLEGKWTYDYNAVLTSGVTTGNTRVRCFDINDTVLLDERHYFLGAQRFLQTVGGNPDGTGYSLWSTGLERRSELRDTNGTTVLGASEQDWTQRAPVVWTGQTAQQIANDNRVNEARKILDDGSTSRSHTAYDQFNNPTRVDEYDFDDSLTRYTTISYVTGSPYWGSGVNSRNMVRMPLQQSVFDGPAGAELARTTYEYDNYTNDPNNPNNQPLTSYTDFASIPGHTASYDQNFIVRGNATKVTRRVSSSLSLDSYTRYDVLGNVVSAKDPKGNVATISYTDDFANGAAPGFGISGAFGPTYSLPTLITSPPPNPGEPAHTARSQYDFSTGLLTGFKDRNGTITQTLYNDSFDRPTQIKAALGETVETHTAMYYAPTTALGVSLIKNDVLTAQDQAGLDDGNLRSWTKTDGFGRTIESWTHAPDELYQGSPVSGDIVVKANYDGLGRTKQTSNPFRPAVLSETALYTTTAYDLAGRVITVTAPDNAIVSTAYDGPRVLVTDQAGKQRISKTDGLGRLTGVWEIRSADTVTGTEAVTFPNHAEVVAGYRTNYSYDALDDLTQVKQQIGTTGTTQTRTFGYDSLKRLTSAFNPESGTVSYSYDNNGNLRTKTDSRVPAVTTTYEYDALNRVKSRTYSDTTPAVAYKYDAQTPPTLPTGAPAFTRGSSTGRLVAVIYGSGNTGTYQGYDQMGRAVQSIQVTETQATGTATPQAYGFTYSYNLASEMLTETYPSGRIVQTEYDTAGRVAGVRNQGATTYYAGASASDTTNRIQYAAHGAVSALKLGNGKWEHTTYDPKRLQPTQIGLGTSSTDSSLLKLEYGYGTTSNNGNVVSQTITAPKTGGGNLVLTQNYSYDALNRLASANENSGSSWSQTYDYDRYGNRAVRASSYMPTARQTPTSSSSDVSGLFNQNNNRITATSEYVYDPGGSGNLISMSNKIQGADTMTYDAENRQKTYIPSQGGTTTYTYDGDGHRVKKVDPNNATTVFVYNVGGQLVAEYTSGAPSGGGTSYLTSDHLGSTRVVTKQDGTVKARYDYLPFGEEIGSDHGSRTLVTGYGVTEGTRQKFTQKERDSESGLDYFLARYYSSAQGRFTSVDPIGTTLSRLIDPQRFNRYSYVRNNPLKHIDPDGRDLKLKAGMKKADVDRIMKINVSIYRKESGRVALERMESSAIPITNGTGKLPTTVTQEGTRTRINERYGETSREGTGSSDAQGKLKTVDLKSISVTYDFEKRDAAQSRSLTDSRFPSPDSEQHVGKHETGHVNALITDPVKEITATTDESEAYAEDFAKKIEKEPNTMKETDAEKRVKEMFGYESYEFADKKKKKND